jgi:LysR family transcriptional regulator, cyn operon transcriptional activator
LHLCCFTVLAERLNFTRAAERVRIRSASLREIGRPLFDRVGKRVVLTESDELFVAFKSPGAEGNGLGVVRNYAIGSFRLTCPHAAVA